MQKLESALEEFDRLQETLSTNLTLSITMTSGDTNAWGDMYQSWIIVILCRVLLPIFALCCCYFATRRFMTYWAFDGSKIALICLFIEAITNLMRALYCMIDPFWSQGILSWQASRMMVFITFPWSLSTSMLIGFVWAEAIAHATPMKGGFLSRYKVHFIVILVLFILLELFSSIVHAFLLPLRIRIVLATALLGICAQLLVAVLFLVYGVKVLRALSPNWGVVVNVTNSLVRARRLRRMTKRIVGSAVGMIIFVAASIPGGTRTFFTPYGFVLSLWGVYLGVQITSIFQIFAFSKAPYQRSSSVVAPSEVVTSDESKGSVHVS